MEIVRAYARCGSLQITEMSVTVSMVTVMIAALPGEPFLLYYQLSLNIASSYKLYGVETFRLAFSRLLLSRLRGLNVRHPAYRLILRYSL